MKVWIIYSKAVLNPNKSNALSWMLNEATRAGFKAEILFREDITIKTFNCKLKVFNKNIEMKLPDFVFTRCYDIDLLKHFEYLGIKTFNNSSSMENCLNKWRTHQLLSLNNIPTPNSIYSISKKSYEDIKFHFSDKFIVKELKGAQGTNIFLVTDEDSFNNAINQCDQPLFQEYIDTSYGKDIRVHVIGEKVIASVLRTAKNGFKSNFSLGGEVQFYEPNDRIKSLAIKSAKALNLDFAGIDILFTENDYTVCEVNGVPGFRTIGITSDINIPRKMFDYMKIKMRS